ncbi:MAG TPA: polymer-forming cytoskeletal protein, partial [Gemmatimonadales bacterium]|nr:polymer-forming cytoskeletal protein [Gemmatimonadales bacterium]
MPASRRLLAAALLLVAPGTPLQAEASKGTPGGPAELVHDLWNLVTDVSVKVGLQDRPTRPQPQVIAAGGPSLDLSDLSRPDLIEDRLRDALQSRRGEPRLTVAGGTARRGDFSLGSAETLTGNLLVVEGDADVSGTLRGNLVTVEGDVVVHPGGVISGDVLTLGGSVRDEGGEIGGEVRTLKSTTVLSPLPQARAEAASAFETVLRRIAGVLGVFLTLAVLGFGLVMFGRQNLEVVSDTVSHSFGRAF